MDGWDVGWEEMTQMFVKRRGRGVFRFESAVIGACGGLRDGDDDVVDGDSEGRLLEDGFEYRDWVDADEGGEEREEEEEEDGVEYAIVE